MRKGYQTYTIYITEQLKLSKIGYTKTLITERLSISNANNK